MATLTTSQNYFIRSFRKQFFQRFGLDLEIAVKLPTFALNGIEFQNTQLGLLVTALNEQIPYDIKEQYPEITIFSKTRKRPIVELRHIFIKLSREMGYKLQDIAYICGYKDHSTVIYGVEQANDLLQINGKFLKLYNTVTDRLQELTLQEENARTNKPIEPLQDNGESDDSSTLYTGEHEARSSGTKFRAGSNFMPDGGISELREQVTN